MRLLLLFLFLAYPMLEIALLIKVGGQIGVWPLIAIIVLTAVAGGYVLRRTGFAVLRRMSETMAQGRPPVESALDGTLAGAAGMMLMLPGLITDTLGIVLLIPPVRSLIVAWIARQMTVTTFSDPFTRPTAERGQTSDGQAEPPGSPRDPRPATGGRRPRSEPIIIEGEFERLDERPLDPKKSDRD